VLIDYSRPKLPVAITDVIVPIYPEVGDMVNVLGDDDDLWFAHVLSCDRRSQTSRVHFYTENNGKYIRSRTAVETIHWNSIASGCWHEEYWLLL